MTVKVSGLPVSWGDLLIAAMTVNGYISCCYP